MLTLTDNAALKIAQLIAAEGNETLALRVGVRPGGCAGFAYDMCFDTETDDGDTIEIHGDITIVCDPASAQLLAGATIDYHDGLTNSGFTIKNPNASRSCGCGQSFS